MRSETTMRAADTPSCATDAPVNSTRFFSTFSMAILEAPVQRPFEDGADRAAVDREAGLAVVAEQEHAVAGHDDLGVVVGGLVGRGDVLRARLAPVDEDVAL